jgi:toxin secretion/phage lysis holin
MKEGLIVGAGVFGAIIASAFGGWDTALQALVVFMIIDYITGITAAFFKKDKKGETAGLSSRRMLKGFIKKGIMLLIVLVGVQIDHLLGTDFVRYAVIFAFIANELVSILENACVIGITDVPVLKKIVAFLNEKGDK